MNRFILGSDPIQHKTVQPKPRELPHLANSLDRFLDSDSRVLCSNLINDYSQYHHVLANEPTIAMYRISEHIRRTIPQLEQRKLELQRASVSNKGGTLDAGYAAESVKVWKVKNTGAKYANMNAMLQDVIARCRNRPVTPSTPKTKSVSSPSPSPLSPTTKSVPSSPVVTPVEQQQPEQQSPQKPSIEIPSSEETTQPVVEQQEVEQEQQQQPQQQPQQQQQIQQQPEPEPEPEQQQQPEEENILSSPTEEDINTPPTTPVTEEADVITDTSEPKTPKTKKKKKKKKTSSQPTALTIKQF
jgi:DNA polymerase III gamma/tau subunit